MTAKKIWTFYKGKNFEVLSTERKKGEIANLGCASKYLFLTNYLVLSQSQLLLQALGHLRRRRSGKAQGDLYGVVDEPLQGGQGTDHDDTGSQTLPQTYKFTTICY